MPDSDPIDEREILVNLLKTAIPQSFRKTAAADSALVNRCPEGETKVLLGARMKKRVTKKERGRAMCDQMSRAIREMDSRRCQEVDSQIQSWKESGTYWWKEPSRKPPARVDWFDMPSTEIDADVKRDLEVLALRGAFNPKRHYKNLEGIRDATWVQLGTVMDNPVEGARGRLPKKLRNKRTLTQQWMADGEMGPALEKRFASITEEEAKIDALRAQQFPLMERRRKRQR